MPTATFINDEGNTITIEYTLPVYEESPVPVCIESCLWCDAEQTKAKALVDGRWLAYHPSDDTKTHYTIVNARNDGVLTGQTTPGDYVAPEQATEPTPQEKRAAAYIAECDPILVQIEGYKLENEITGTNGKDDRITELKALWKQKRDAIRELYPDA